MHPEIYVTKLGVTCHAVTVTIYDLHHLNRPSCDRLLNVTCLFRFFPFKLPFKFDLFLPLQHWKFKYHLINVNFLKDNCSSKSKLHRIESGFTHACRVCMSSMCWLNLTIKKDFITLKNQKFTQNCEQNHLLCVFAGLGPRRLPFPCRQDAEFSSENLDIYIFLIEC